MMLETVIHNLSVCDPNTIGLISGFVGAILVTIFGLPPIGLLNEGMYVGIEITNKMKWCMWVSRSGLLFIAIGFIFQLSSIGPVP
ncbi:MAG TPA: hypothetical protein ENI80_12000 [Acidiferrobacteraceae bacterium]|nr:hypothetical protein [Acidiferrobacteraceae bacterium]